MYYIVLDVHNQCIELIVNESHQLYELHFDLVSLRVTVKLHLMSNGFITITISIIEEVLNT